MNRVIKPNNTIALFRSEPFSSFLRISNIKNDWIWNKILKTGHLNAKRMPMRKHEIISHYAGGQVDTSILSNIDIKSDVD